MPSIFDYASDERLNTAIGIAMSAFHSLCYLSVILTYPTHFDIFFYTCIIVTFFSFIIMQFTMYLYYYFMVLAAALFALAILGFSYFKYVTHNMASYVCVSTTIVFTAISIPLILGILRKTVPNNNPRISSAFMPPSPSAPVRTRAQYSTPHVEATAPPIEVEFTEVEVRIVN